MFDHLVVRVIDMNSPVFVFGPCPSELGGFATADGDDASTRYAVEEGANMAFAHAAEACDGDGDLDVLFGGHREGWAL